MYTNCWIRLSCKYLDVSSSITGNNGNNGCAYAGIYTKRTRANSALHNLQVGTLEKITSRD